MQAPLLGEGGGGRRLLMGRHGKAQGLAVAAASLVLLALAAQDFSRMHAGVSMLEMEQLADVSVPSSSFPSYYAGVQSLAGGQPSIAGAVGQSLATAGGSACGGGAVATTLGCGGGSYQTISYGAPYTAMPGYGYGTPFAAPVGYNAYQNPTVWNGDHVTSGGEPEWASEDAAQHALNLANWRIKLLQAKLQQAKLASKVMNVGTPLETHMAKTSAKVSSSDQAQLASLRKGLSSLAKQTTHAMSALAAKIDANKVHHKTRASHEKLRMLKRDTDRELSDILKRIDAVSATQ